MVKILKKIICRILNHQVKLYFFPPDPGGYEEGVFTIRTHSIILHCERCSENRGFREQYDLEFFLAIHREWRPFFFSEIEFPTAHVEHYDRCYVHDGVRKVLVCTDRNFTKKQQLEWNELHGINDTVSHLK